MYALTAPPTVQPLYALGMALLYALLVAVTRTSLLERRYRVRAWALAAAADRLAACCSCPQLAACCACAAPTEPCLW